MESFKTMIQNSCHQEKRDKIDTRNNSRFSMSIWQIFAVCIYTHSAKMQCLSSRDISLQLLRHGYKPYSGFIPKDVPRQLGIKHLVPKPRNEYCPEDPLLWPHLWATVGEPALGTHLHHGDQHIYCGHNYLEQTIFADKKTPV